jgi:hypothetical protein
VQAGIDRAEGRNDEALQLLQRVAGKDDGLFASDGDIS